MFHISHTKRKKTVPHWDNLFISESPSKRVVYKTHTLPYSRHELATTVYKACMKAFGYAGEAETTAVEVCKAVEHWLADKHEVTEADIMRQAAKALHLFNPRAAYVYSPVKEYAVTEDQYGFIRL